MTEPFEGIDPALPRNRVYPLMSRATVRGRAMPTQPHVGLVAADVHFPDNPVVHRYDRVYPNETIQDDRTGRILAVNGAMPIARNDAALARNGVARLVRCIPVCDIRLDGMSFHELTTGYAMARGAIPCNECWPE